MEEARTTIVFGPPGTGKTTRLLSEVATYLNEGIPSIRIGFVSFTRQAAEEAKSRACTRFDLKRKDLINFRTLHSMAFQMLGLRSESVMKYAHYKEIADACGLTVSSRVMRMNAEEGLWIGATKGDKILFLENLARVSNIPLKDVLTSSEFFDIEQLELDLFSRTLKSFKDANVLVDFTDMVQNWLHHGTTPLLDVLFIDEAQDLSAQQWKMVEKLTNQNLDTWVAGDDDQAIFKWSGASPEKFTSIPGQRITLNQSYRIPKVVHKLALEIRGHIKDSIPKEYAPREEQGFLDFYGELEQVNMDQGEWLILCRNNYFIAKIEETCRKLGYFYDSLFDPSAKYTIPIINYHKWLSGSTLTIAALEEVLRWMGKTINLKQEYKLDEFIEEYQSSEQRLCNILLARQPWYDAFSSMPIDKRSYYRAVLKRKEDITRLPRIRISTIHGAKGGEEENVVLITDMSEKTFAKATLDWTDEYRVWYVGVTRAKATLHIVRPQTNKCLPLFEL